MRYIHICILRLTFWREHNDAQKIKLRVTNNELLDALGSLSYMAKSPVIDDPITDRNPIFEAATGKTV